MTVPETSNSDERIPRVQRLLREAVEVLSDKANDQFLAGGVQTGIAGAELKCRQALAELYGVVPKR